MKTKNELCILTPFFKEFTSLNNIELSKNNIWDIHATLCHEQNVLAMAARNNQNFKTQVDIEELKTQRKYRMPYNYPYRDFYLGREDLNDNHLETLFKNLIKNLYSKK